jgi:hypothetical protein
MREEVSLFNVAGEIVGDEAAGVSGDIFITNHDDVVPLVILTKGISGTHAGNTVANNDETLLFTAHLRGISAILFLRIFLVVSITSSKVSAPRSQLFTQGGALSLKSHCFVHLKAFLWI